MRCRIPTARAQCVALRSGVYAALVAQHPARDPHICDGTCDYFNHMLRQSAGSASPVSAKKKSLQAVEALRLPLPPNVNVGRLAGDRVQYGCEKKVPFCTEAGRSMATLKLGGSGGPPRKKRMCARRDFFFADTGMPLAVPPPGVLARSLIMLAARCAWIKLHRPAGFGYSS